MKIEIDAIHALAAHHDVDAADALAVVADALTTAYAATDAAEPGDTIEIGADGTVAKVSAAGDRSVPAGFSRIAAATARQAVVAWSRDVDRRKVVGTWAHREGTVVDAVVSGPGRNGETRMSVDGVAAVLPAGEQTPGEDLPAGRELKVLLLAANADQRGNIKLTVSRRQPLLVTQMIRDNCPEVRSGAVEVVGVAREPGVRTKVALRGTVDPVAAVVGAGGHRLRPVVAALAGEKVDLVVHSADPATFAAAALTPAKAAGASATDEVGRNVTVRVPVAQLELATGKGGINVRLAQRLTKTKITVQPVD